jgi:hypothetical protein
VSPASCLPPSGGGSGKSSWPRSGSSPNAKTEATAAQGPKWKRGGAAALTCADLARVGIQMGKTKVFLRHKAFEALERVRCIEQSNAATKLNSIFRRYLARIAYLPYRNALRLAKDRRRLLDANHDEFKETKEEDYNADDSVSFEGGSGGLNKSYQSALAFHSGSSSFAGEGFYDKWTEMQIKEAIHNPVPRHEWGKQAPDEEKFKWVIRDGLWVKKYSTAMLLNESM